ncbi:MAG: hypothetical protein Q9167_002626 [Letrouitia subvulpina]
MYTFSLILTTLISFTSAKPIFPRHHDPATPASFGLIALRSASPIHYGSIDASGYAFYIGKETVSYCPDQVGKDCPPGKQTIISYFNGTASMDVLVPGGQRVFVAPNGALGYTVPHSGAIPEGAVTKGFVYDAPKSNHTDAFDLYHLIHESNRSTKPILDGPALPALGHAIAGATGAATSNILTYPLALIITRLQIQRSLRKGSSLPSSREYRSVRNAAARIFEQEGGVAGFYTGALPDTAKTIADSFLFFLAYNFLRQTRLRARNGSAKHLPAADELGVGFLAGAFSKLLTTPIANIVTRQQASSLLSHATPQSASKGLSIRSIALRIRSEKGLQGFWSGYSASLVLTLNPSLTFFLFETFKRLLLPRKLRANPPPQATFFLAAISKAIASTITYPFSLAKARTQASSNPVHENEADGSVEKGVKEDKQSTTPTAQKAKAKAKAKPQSSDVFSMIARIARTEGIGALYEGLGGEVLKGFFSHGITMIVKETVHGMIIRLYYALLRLLRRYPYPGTEELAGQAMAHAKGYVRAGS